MGPQKPIKRHITWLYFEIDISDSFGGLWQALAALLQLWAATITQNHLNMAEMDSATQKKNEMTYHL